MAGRASDRIDEEQAALRRVATLVARAAPAEEMFAAVVAEVGRLLGAHITALARYDQDDAITYVGMWTSTGAAASTPVGSRLPVRGRNVTTRVVRTGRPMRIHAAYTHGAGVPGPIGISATRVWGLRSAVCAPIGVEGRLWGHCWFYQAASQGPTFFDVTQGSNDLAWVGCYRATVGYDAASGLGVPNWATLGVTLPKVG
jgi:GAF domain-containing protein